MRIACIYLPSFPVQVHVRRAPHLAGRAFAVSDDSQRPNVLACSRAAWQQGVRPGMSVARARTACPELILRERDAAIRVAALEALGESLLSYSALIDIGTVATFDGQFNFVFSALMDLASGVSTRDGPYINLKPTADVPARRTAPHVQIGVTASQTPGSELALNFGDLTFALEALTLPAEQITPNRLSGGVQWSWGKKSDAAAGR